MLSLHGESQESDDEEKERGRNELLVFKDFKDMCAHDLW